MLYVFLLQGVYGVDEHEHVCMHLCVHLFVCLQPANLQLVGHVVVPHKHKGQWAAGGFWLVVE